MTVKTGLKAQAVQMKSVGADAGEFEALVAVFNNIDSYGDVIVKGAFADTLSEWQGSGYPIPVVWSHDKDDPFSHIGHVTEAKETDTGLLVKAQLDLENPKAAQVHRLLKGGRVKEFSFAFSYDPADVNPTKRDGVEVRELKRLKLYEVGPTLVGANPATELMSVKSLEGSAGDAEGKSEGDDEGGVEDPQAMLVGARAALSDTIDRLNEVVSVASDMVGRIDGMLGREDDGAEDSDDSDDASRSQAGEDEAHAGKSDPAPAVRSAEDHQNLAAIYAALAGGD